MIEVINLFSFDILTSQMEIFDILNVIIFYTIFVLYVICIAHFISTIKHIMN